LRLLILFCLLFIGLQSQAATYYISPNGSDSNPGTQLLPYLSPSHAFNCGDTLIAVPSTSYSASNFGPSKWGVVLNCSVPNVAWLICQTFDGCKITATTYSGMQVTTSYWGIAGWEVTVNAAASNAYSCFSAIPNSGTPIHHIIFANDIANGCNADAFQAANTGSTGYDYIAYIGNIAYNGAQGSTSCASGFSFYQPVLADTLPGTHLYMAGNFAFGNVDPATCNGTAPTDGEGFIIDTPDWSQHSGTNPPYTGQIVVENNLSVFNGGRGIQLLNNAVSGSTYAHIYAVNNTVYGNNLFTNNAGNACAELYVYSAIQTEVYNNLSMPAAATACSSNPWWAATVLYGSASDFVYKNFLYSAAGHNTVTANSGSFAFGPNNITGTNPVFNNPVAPGAPSCSGYASVPACMASVIANFTSSNAIAASYGRQAPSSSLVFDPLFPSWLCNVTLPTGLISIGCAGNSSSQGVTLNGVGIL
jgi:hypothetical protein